MDCRRKPFARLLLAVCLLLPVAASADLSPERLLAEGRVDAAITSLQHKIDTVPNDAESYNLLCRAYSLLDNWDAGISACQKAVSLDPRNSNYHLWLGRVYGEKADHSAFLSAAGLARKVRNEFETAVRLDPKSLDARTDLAQFYVEAPGIVGGGREKAEAQAQALASLDPVQAYEVQAWIAEKRKDFRAAETTYRSAIQASAGGAGPWLNLAQFYGREGRLDEMQEALQHAMSGPNNRHLLMQGAEVLIRSKRDLPRAIELLRRYLASGTVEEAPAFKAHYLLGTLLEQDGDRAAAAQEYRAALSLAKGFAPAQKALERLDRQIASNVAPR